MKLIVTTNETAQQQQMIADAVAECRRHGGTQADIDHLIDQFKRITEAEAAVGHGDDQTPIPE